MSKCKYYPCHNGVDNCMYCYCPVYPCGIPELGKFAGKVWDCSDCEVIHRNTVVQDITKLIINYLKEVVKDAKR